MNRILLFSILLLTGFQLKAQNNVAVNIVIPPPFTPFLSDYTTFGGQNVITLTNTTSNTYSIKLVGSIVGEDNGLFLFTKPNYQPAVPIVLGPFQSYTVTASSPSRDFLTDANTESNINQQQRDAILASGVLPEGSYKVCVRAVDYFTNEPYSEQDPLGCTFVYISFPLPPILLNPMCHSEVQNPFPSFNWTPVISSGSFMLYDLYILKLLPTQIPEDAMWLAIASNVGNPIRIPNLAAPVYQYKPYDIPLIPGEQYAWCVVARDVANQIVITNQGRSEVCTFTFNPTAPPVVSTPVITQSGVGALPEFSLNNTSISGKILYRYKTNENFGDPGSPAYNPSITVYDEPRNIAELNAMQAVPTSGSTPAPLGGNSSSPTSPALGSFFNSNISTQGYADLMGQAGFNNLGNPMQGKIRIDPSKKHLYANTLSLANAEPLRQTSVSLYLEYVALKRVEDGEQTYFQIVPAADAVYNRTGIGQHSGFMDPQLQMTTAYSPVGGTTTTVSRPSGSELLATAITDTDGNFTFNFDLTENTGLLNAGPTTLRYFKLTEPPIQDHNQWVHPLDMISNPIQNITNPIQDVINQFNDVVNGGQTQQFGNTQLQGNQGWGNQTNFNNTNLSAPNQNLNKNLNINMKGPSGEMIYYPDDLAWIEWSDYKVHHLFKVLRIRINDPYYCHPDVLIFAQPGDQIAVPPVATFVNSFNMRVKIKAGGSVADDPYLAPGSAMSGFNVRLGRLKSFWDNKPHNFPLHEGLDMQPESFFTVNSNTPYFKQWDQGANKPGQLKFTSQDVSSSNGTILFRNLVRNRLSQTADAHYFEVIYPQTSIYNYQGLWGSVRVSTNGYYNDFANVVVIPHSYNFAPKEHEEDCILQPLNPELLLRTIVRSTIETAGLPDVNVFMLEYTKNPNLNVYNYKGYKQAKTDVNGYRRFTNLDIALSPNGGALNPFRRVMLTKNGYKTIYNPSDIPDPGNNEANYIQPVKKGQRVDLTEIEMIGNANVHGFVKDEFDNPVMALIKIGDGPYHMTSNTMLGGGFDNVVHSNGQNPPTGGSGQINSAGLFTILNTMNSGSSSSGDGNLFSINPTNYITQQNIGNFAQEGVSVTANLGNFSRFQINAAATGNNTRVIIIPMSDQYFPDTFYVNVPTSNQSVNIGTFKVFEKAHRVSIQVKRQVAGALVNASNALIEVGEVAGVTNSQGICNLRFTTPDAYFRVFVKDGNQVPIEEYRYIPISKNYTVINYTTIQGLTVRGKVTAAVGGEGIEGARVYAATGITSYGQTIVQTFTDAQGNYELRGVPPSALSIFATKQGSNPTYIGKTTPIPPGSSVVLPITLNIALQSAGDLDISKLFGFNVEVLSLSPNGADEFFCSGAFVNIQPSGNFKVYNPDARVRFSNIIIKKSEQANANGIYKAVPRNNQANTLELTVRMRLFDKFITDLKGDNSPGTYNRVVVTDEGNSQGAFRGRVVTDLESFRFSFNYQGNFIISENTENVVMKPIRSSNQPMVRSFYHVVDHGANNVAKDIQFSIHNFNAKADKDNSRIDQQQVRLATKLYPNLPLATQSEVDAGFIRVTPNSININNPGHQIAFKLEEWEVKSTNGWSYSIPHGGIIIPKAKITTQMVDIPVNNLILRPSQLIMPADEIDLSNLTLGGGVTKLNQYSGTKALLNFDPACSFDLGPHWRFSIFRSPASSPACYLMGLPGFVVTERIDIGSFTLFSNNSTLIQPIQQAKKYFNIVDFNIQNIINGKDYVELAGSLFTGIPGVTPPSVIMEYTKPGSTIIRKTKTIDLVMETPGKVFFNGYQGNEHYVLYQNYFEANGSLAFENDDPNDGKLILLRGKVTKTPTEIKLTIPKLLNNNTDQAFQYIPLAGGNGKLKVLNGEQRVVGGAWNTLTYTADLINPNSTDGLNNRTLDYQVVGAVRVDPSSGNSVKIDQIKTPLGGLTMVFDWEKGSFMGTLTVNVPIALGALVELTSGTYEVMFSGEGFYFDMIGQASVTGLSFLSNINFGFLTGYYPKLPPHVINRHKNIMNLLDVPQYIKNDGIRGVYMNANASPPVLNWSVSVPLPLFSVGFGVNVGADLNFLMNFGPDDKVMAVDVGAYAKAWAGVNVLMVCQMCVGAMGVFQVGGVATIGPQASVKATGCASFSLFGSFCGAPAEKTIGCDIKIESTYGEKTGFEADVIWSPCGSAANKIGMDCNF